MNICKVYLNESNPGLGFYAATSELDVSDAVKAAQAQGAYRWIGTFETDKENEHAAEDMFDLSNNPCREVERDFRWGGNRSLSPGDLVQVNDNIWVCAAVGWVKV